ncbi:hypothetical protein [Paraburkholderia sp. SIMBA_030]|uniref:hypothetical protein n=1 Tax=Paraburkholderia sp. SIMBA_030 TaxID=3085773 RepID=UPI00397B51E6
MKKWFAALLVSLVTSSHASSDSSIDATVESAAGMNENGGFVVLRSTDGTCRYYGVLQETARAPRKTVERMMALTSGGKVYDWMTVISYSACLQRDGNYVKQRISLVSPGGQRLRIGDGVVLRSSI